MKHRAWACALGLVAGAAAQAEPCSDGFKSSGNFLSGSKYSTQASLLGVKGEQAFQRALRFTAANGFTVQSADPKTGEIRAAQSAQLAKGKQVPLDITVRDEPAGAQIALRYATGPGQLSPEGAIKDHFCKTVAAAAVPSASDTAAAPVVAPEAAAAPAIPAIPDSEFIKNGQPCMSGLCLGDTIAQLPKSLRWQPRTSTAAPKGPLGARMVDTLAQNVKGPRGALEQLGTALSVGGTVDADGLAALDELEAVCRPGQARFSAVFRSASGHPTVVMFSPGLDDAGRLRFRVSQMTRSYPAVTTLDQQNELIAAAREQYGPILQAQRSVKPGERSEQPMVTINRIMPPSVMLSESIWIGDRQEQPLMKHPFCGGALPVKLE